MRAGPALDATLLARIEDAGLNASAPPQQRWMDGWLVRLSPGKAKRARCVNAVAPGRMALADKLALCRRLYESAQLPLYFRITPFSQPPDLDLRLERLGMRREDDTRVMVRPDLTGVESEPARKRLRIEPLGHHAFADLVGRFRGSPLAQRQAHAQRLQDSPVPFQGHALLDDDGVAVACGQMATEAELVGLYDVYTLETHRGRGLATALCARLLALARNAGATTGYLQVDAANTAARRVYAQLGFADAYAYHYRTPNGGGTTEG